MSGVEVAGTIAADLSSLVHSPGDKAVENPGRFTVHHVTPRPAWTIPLFTSVKTDASVSPFLPLDFSSCNLALRPQPLVNTQGHITVDAARKSNERFRSALGTDQSDFSPETAIDGELLDQPPFVAISNYYMDFVRSGLIKPCKGRLSKLEGATATVSSNSGDEIITDVAAVVLATGFDPSKSISFLPPSVLETISHSPAHANLPVALAFHGTHHPSLPTLGFVGFYRGPFWGVMEMQARFVARLFQEHATGDIPADSAFRAAIASDESIQRTLALRDDPRCSQFPMGDYAFLMQEFAAALELPISPSLGSLPLMPDGRPLDILTPARYVSPAASDAQKEQALRNLQSTHDSALAGLTGRKFIAAAVFRSLLGEWSLERDLTSKLPSHPSGRFVGTAKFLLRAGTTDGREDKFRDAADESTDQGVEYLYIEDGEFTAAGTNMRFRATRRYIWRYDDTTDTISVWFARTDDPSRADYLFHEVEFGPDHVQGRGGCRAGASHLCIEDLYNVRYEFFFTGVCLLDWRLGYSVLGPRKDYTIDGVYRRTS